MASLNLGIVAHVDAGKTTLTERLLHAAGVIDEIGSVDDGTTQTDSLALERQRGITIKSAVVSFPLAGLTVNLIDTPGHPDFIAEVERVLSVLDGAVLVISAVEGVQAQTRVLMRALQRLRLPTLLFVNKIDRGGAAPDRVLRGIAERLTPAAVPMGTVTGAGTRRASATPYPAAVPEFTARLVDVLAEHDDALLAAYVDDEASLSPGRLRAALADQTRQALVHPVFFGSAVTGAGVAALTTGVSDLLPSTSAPAAAGPVSGSVFKVERGRAGERIAYVRLYSGTLRVRDRVPLRHGGGHRHGDREGKVTAIQVFADGAARPQPAVVAGQIGKVWGLGEVRIGDPVGLPPATHQHRFAPPTLETVVVAARPADKHALHAALSQLAEQDPLINLRRDGIRQEVSVSLYGEVQKEVIQSTLATEYGLDVSFLPSSTLCVERPVRPGEAVELLQEEANPFRATIGLRIEPAPPGTGVEFRLRVDPRTVPTHLYRSVDGFTEMMGRYVRETLQEGRYGWPVTDCVVAMTRCAYSVADGPPSLRGPDSTTADFRKLTPLVVMAALQQAGTSVNEPIHRYHLEVPVDTLGAVLPALAQLAAAPHAQVARGATHLLTGDVPAAQVHVLQQRLSGLTRGEALLEATFDHYRPVRGPVPTRPRTDHNPLVRKEYLLHVLRRV